MYHYAALGNILSFNQSFQASNLKKSCLIKEFLILAVEEVVAVMIKLSDFNCSCVFVKVLRTRRVSRHWSEFSSNKICSTKIWWCWKSLIHLSKLWFVIIIGRCWEIRSDLRNSRHAIRSDFIYWKLTLLQRYTICIDGCKKILRRKQWIICNCWCIFKKKRGECRSYVQAALLYLNERNYHLQCETCNVTW